MRDITLLAAGIVASAAGNETIRMRPEDLPALVRSVRAALSDSTKGSAAPPATAAMTKAQASKLLANGKIKSLIDGKFYSTLKRHLSRHGYDADSYRAAFGLPSDFPMVSPQYSSVRSQLAKTHGFAGGHVSARPARAPAEEAASSKRLRSVVAKPQVKPKASTRTTAKAPAVRKRGRAAG